MPRLFRHPAAGILLLAVTLFAPSLAVKAGTIASSALRQPLFEENKGQDHDGVRYRGRFGGYDAAILDDGSLVLRDGTTTAPIRIRPTLGGKRAKLSAAEPSIFKTNYFRGSDSLQYHRDVRHFARVSVSEIYPGIDLVYHAQSGRLEFDFVAAPGADLRAIKIKIEGAKVSLTPEGDMELKTSSGAWVQRRPVAYQDSELGRRPVHCEYETDQAGEISLRLGDYDKAAALTVDPVVDYASYYGATGDDAAVAIRVGADGYLYVAGYTSSSNLRIVGGADSTLGGAQDAFIAKINPATGALIFATYLGGGNSDWATALALGPDGSIYVTGMSGTRFPTSSGAYQSGSSQAGFVTKLNNAGNQILYSTQLLGTTPAAIDVDSQGRAAVTGEAGSLFVTTTGAYQRTYGNSGFSSSGLTGDAFALLLNATGTGVVFASYFGGTGSDDAKGVAIDAAGRVIIGGSTTSAGMSMVGAIQPNMSGPADTFIAAFAANGQSLTYSTYFGGSDGEAINALALDPYGNLIVVGSTGSRDFPTFRALRATVSGLGTQRKGFVAKFATAPLALVFATYTGSNRNCCDGTYSVATDTVGDIYVYGYLEGSDQVPNFPSVHPFITTSQLLARYAADEFDHSDAFFVAGYSRDGQTLRYQTLLAAACGAALYCGDAGAISARSPGMAAVAGKLSEDWMAVSAFNTQAAWSSTTQPDAFVMTFVTESPSLELTVDTFSVTSGGSLTLTATSYVPGSSGSVTFFDGTTTLGTAPLVEGIATFSTTVSAGVRRLKARLGSTDSDVVFVPVQLP